MEDKQLLELFDTKGFSPYACDDKPLLESKDIQLNTYTKGRINNIVCLNRSDEDNMTIFECYKQWLEDFDIDEEIRLHMEVPMGEWDNPNLYATDHSYAECVEDYTNYIATMKALIYGEVAEELTESEIEIKNLKSYIVFLEEELRKDVTIAEGILEDWRCEHNIGDIE